MIVVFGLPVSAEGIRLLARLALPVLLVVVLAGAILPSLAPPSGRWMDKLFHAAAFGTLAVSATIGSASRRQARIGWLLLAVLGLAVEGMQWLIPGRSASLGDGAASVLGVAAGAAVTVWMLHHLRLFLGLRG